jgi:hypothetical protein
MAAKTRFVSDFSARVIFVLWEESQKPRRKPSGAYVTATCSTKTHRDDENLLTANHVSISID